MAMTDRWADKQKKKKSKTIEGGGGGGNCPPLAPPLAPINTIHYLCYTTLIPLAFELLVSG